MRIFSSLRDFHITDSNLYSNKHHFSAQTLSQIESYMQKVLMPSHLSLLTSGHMAVGRSENLVGAHSLGMKYYVIFWET